MNFKHALPASLAEKAANFSEFANGGAQATIKLKSGAVYKEALISASKWIVAMRGYKDLPFLVTEIEDVFQSEEDLNPKRRGGWDFWDDWGAA